MDANRVIILDTTLRDGEQTPGLNLSLNEKLKIARQLERLGVDIIEAGFPASSPADFEGARAVSQSVSCGVAALCRCIEEDIVKGWEAIKYAKAPRLHLFIAGSDLHLGHKLRITREQALENAFACVRLAKRLCDDIQFSCEDASRAEPAFLYRLLEAGIAGGAATVCVPDTVGYCLPDEYGALIRGVRENVKGIENVRVSVHCHNDLGLAVANTLSGLAGGGRQIEVTVNGIGERAGNCSLEEAVMAMTVRASLCGLSHNIDTKRLFRTSRQVERLTGISMAPNKPVVGANAFSHESGIHQHGVMVNPLTYEIMTPQSVGRKKSLMVLGKHSGRHAFSDRLEEMGYALTRQELDAAFADFKGLAERKKTVTEQDLEAIVQQRMIDVPDYYALKDYQVQSGNAIKSVACITLLHNNTPVTDTAIGAGPIDAAYNAVVRVAGGEWPLVSYNIKAVTGGVDALGEVTVRVNYAGEIHIGRGLSPDIIEASILAYVNAINRGLAMEARKT